MVMRVVVEKFVEFYESVFGKSVLEKEASYLLRELKHCQRILDIGCGIGSFEQRLRALHIVGLDGSKEMLEEARKRSNKAFVLGNAENLGFSNSSFDAVFFVTTLEFLSDYKKAILETWGATKPNGKLLVMALNPESEYFKERMQRKDSHFRKIKHTNLKEISNSVSRFYDIEKEEFFLGIKRNQVFDTADKRHASLYVIVGKKVNE